MFSGQAGPFVQWAESSTHEQCSLVVGVATGSDQGWINLTQEPGTTII